MKNKLTKIIVSGLSLLPLAAFAQIPDISSTDGGLIPEASDTYTIQNLISTANTGIAIFVSILVTLSVLFMVWGGFTYITSGGDSDKVKDAKNRVVYGLVGIGVMILAVAAFNIIGSFLG